MPNEPTVVAKDIDGGKHVVPVSQLSWRPSAYGIVIKDRQLLTAKHFGRHNLPGGGIELGETPEQAVVREVKEETGIDVANPKFITLEPSFFAWVADDGEQFFQTLLLYYVCDFVGGEFSMDGFDEHEKQYADMPEWYPLTRLSALKCTGTHDWRNIVAQVAKLPKL